VKSLEGNEGRSGVCADCTDRPKATYQSPTAMFADLSARPVSGLTSAFQSCWRLAFPRPTQWLSDSPLLVYRCGGSAGMGSGE
jgi:hypothetical protein